jgi:SAM-dependent methyltransferase
MDPIYEQKYHELEAKHWWFRSRREKVLSMMDIKADRRYLDIGCSTGALMQMLVEAGAKPEQVYGVDISDPAIARARQRGLPHVHQMDAEQITLPQGFFDYIVSSDCLEHLRNDKKALANWFELLKPGGSILIFVPAFMSLWSEHDVVNHHFRRYEPGELAAKMEAAGFEVEQTGYWNFFLFMPIWSFRMIKRLMRRWVFNSQPPQEDLKTPNPLVNKLLYGLLQWENQIMRLVRFPFGVSTFVKAKKPLS